MFTYSGCASSSATHKKGVAQIKALGEEEGSVVQLRRAGCGAGDCPVYSVAVFMDGTTVYEGVANVAVLGERRVKLPADRVSDLINAMGKADFLNTPEECCMCPNAKRPRLVMIDYRPGLARKSILHDETCGAAPDALNGLTDTIERVAGVRGWTDGDQALAETPPQIRTSGAPVAEDPVGPATASDLSSQP
jgi:hypothetical protein